MEAGKIIFPAFFVGVCMMGSSEFQRPVLGKVRRNPYPFLKSKIIRPNRQAISGNCRFLNVFGGGDYKIPAT
jgi:hypothetical protein